MDENLVGFLLGSLDDEGMRQVEAYLQSNPDARRRLALLKQAMAPLALDEGEVSPPPGLVGRTLATIADQCPELPRAPRDPSAPAPVLRGWWRADVIVAAAVLLVAAGMAWPLIHHWQRQRDQVVCQNNLRQFFAALAEYRDQQGTYPDQSREGSRNVAGLVVPLLADAGVLPESFSVRCPGVGPHQSCGVTLASLRGLSDADFQAQAPNFAVCYAFALGYRDPDSGGYHGPWQHPASTRPILADGPPPDHTSNSVNHGGAGQNVLFLDGHVRFVPQRTVGNPADDIFLNRANEVAAGLDQRDIVLGPSAAHP
jgi:prepilin-type processing-associated H-X9-DG protein